MDCVTPFMTVNGQGVPCGRCMACRLRRTSEWALRMLHETESHSESSFVTLTYDPGHLPGDYDLRKSHLQLFFKRLREAISPRRIRYFACGEYGERFGRPHYHAIIFGIGPRDLEVVEESWGLGFVRLGTVTRNSCEYVASYIFDALASKSAKGDEVRQHSVRPFQLCSKGIGKLWLEGHEEQVLFDLGIKVRGKVRSLPRYYVKRLGDKLLEDDKSQRLKATRNEYHEVMRKRGVTLEGEAEYADRLREQHSEELKFRKERKERKL